MVQEIVQKLTQDPDPSRIIIIVGIPGMGKTEVAIHVSHLLQEKHEKSVIFIEQKQTLSEVCSEILLEIRNSLVPGLLPNPDIVSIAKRRLKELHEKKIIVLDNVEGIQQQEKQFDDFLEYVGRHAPRVQLIITSRMDVDCHSLSVHKVLLDRLDPDSSVKFLQDSVPDQNELHIKELGELCGIPLVLIQFVCVMKHGLRAETLVRRLRKSPIQLLKINAEKAYNDLCTFLHHLPETITADLVRLSVFPFAFSVEDMKILFGDLLEPEDVKAKMVGYSLLRRINHTKVVLHPLVREFLKAERKRLNKDDIGKEAQKKFNQHYVTLLKSLSKQFITKQSKEAISIFRAEKANILEMFKNFLQGEVDQEDTEFCIDVANSTAVLDFLAKVLSPPSECLKLYEDCYHIAEASNDMRRRADCQTSLGFLGLYKEAHRGVSQDTLEKFQRAYEIRKNLPKEQRHCETHAHTLSKFGLCYALQVKKKRRELSVLNFIASIT